MKAEDRAAFLGGIESIARSNVRRPETRAAFLAVAESLADNCGSATEACEAIQLVIRYGQEVVLESHIRAREFA